jgi:hypothetical protein
MTDTDYANSIKRRRLPLNGLMELVMLSQKQLCQPNKRPNL